LAVRRLCISLIFMFSTCARDLEMEPNAIFVRYYRKITNKLIEQSGSSALPAVCLLLPTTFIAKIKEKV